MKSSILMFEDPVFFIAFLVMVFSHLGMGGIAKDRLGAKGIHALWIMSFPVCLFHYIDICKEENNRIGILFWVFLVSLAVFAYKLS